MSKRDCNRKGYLKGSVRSRIVCEKQLLSIEKTAKDKKEISLFLPRFIKIRDDKDQANSVEEI